MTGTTNIDISGLTVQLIYDINDNNDIILYTGNTGTGVVTYYSVQKTFINEKTGEITFYVLYGNEILGTRYQDGRFAVRYFEPDPNKLVNSSLQTTRDNVISLVLEEKFNYTL